MGKTFFALGKTFRYGSEYLKGYHTDVEIVSDFPIEKRIKSAKNHSYFCRLPPLKCL